MKVVIGWSELSCADEVSEVRLAKGADLYPTACNPDIHWR
jgi:hypothetical protein